MYRPEPRIVKYLREYDKDLGARWDQFRERWIVTWRGKDVYAAVNEDGSYRPFDERVVTQAKLNDLWTHKSGADYLRILNEENHRLTESGRAKARDGFRQYCIEEGFQKVVGVGQFRGWSPPPNEAWA